VHAAARELVKQSIGFAMPRLFVEFGLPEALLP